MLSCEEVDDSSTLEDVSVTEALDVSQLDDEVSRLELDISLVKVCSIDEVIEEWSEDV